MFRNSPRENNRKNAENLSIKKDEPKQERIKEQKPREEKKNQEKKNEEKKKEEKKKEKSKSESRKERTREKKAGGGKPLSMQQLITQNLPASRERMVRNSDVRVFSRDYHLTYSPQIERSPRPSLHSSVAPVVPELDIEIDPELDMMLAELELDDNFASLGENEQKAWLESLFFMDTKHNPGRQPRDQLSKTKVQKKNTLRVNQDSATRLNPVEPKNRESAVEDPEAAKAVHVNDKMKDLAQDFFKPKTSTPAARKSSISSERKTSIRTATPPEEMPSPPLSRKSSLTTFITPPTSRYTHTHTSGKISRK